MQQKQKELRKMNKCEHDYQFNDYCGAYVCTKCGDHLGLSQCYCGWSSDGAKAELEDDLGESRFNGKAWEVNY